MHRQDKSPHFLDPVSSRSLEVIGVLYKWYAMHKYIKIHINMKYWLLRGKKENFVERYGNIYFCPEPSKSSGTSFLEDSGRLKA